MEHQVPESSAAAVLPEGGGDAAQQQTEAPTDTAANAVVTDGGAPGEARIADGVHVARLHDGNVQEFWTSVWAKGMTGWKEFEASKPFFHNVAKTLQNKSIQEQLLAAMAGTPACAKKVEEDPQAFVKGKRVLVPLCGDSNAVRFFVDLGAELVVGVDLAEVAIRKSVEHNFPSADGFQVTESSVCRSPAGGGDDQARVLRFDLSRRDGGGTGSPVATLFAGSLFDVPIRHLGPFDIVYDRASFVAIPPSLRVPYVATIKTVAYDSRQSIRLPEFANRSTLVLLELIRRRPGPEQLQTGPPFHITNETVTDMYRLNTAEDNSPSSNALVSVDDPTEVDRFYATTPAEDALPFCFALHAFVL